MAPAKKRRAAQEATRREDSQRLDTLATMLFVSRTALCGSLSFLTVVSLSATAACYRVVVINVQVLQPPPVVREP